MPIPISSSALSLLRLAAARAHYDQHVHQEPDWPLYGTIEAACPHADCFIECEPAAREVIRLPFFIHRDATPPALVCPACAAPLNILAIDLAWGSEDLPVRITADVEALPAHPLSPRPPRLEIVGLAPKGKALFAVRRDGRVYRTYPDATACEGRLISEPLAAYTPDDVARYEALGGGFRVPVLKTPAEGLLHVETNIDVAAF